MYGIVAGGASAAFADRSKMTDHQGVVTVVFMRVLLVGDTHGNTGWLERLVLPAATRFDADAICQLGDFGIWSESGAFLEAARCSPVPFFFIDGNHEDHRILARISKGSREPVDLGGSLTYMPRGATAVWGGVSVAFLGGAVSIDRRYRTEGRYWFAEEALSADDVAAVLRLDCQVLLTHDTPSGFPLPLPPVTNPLWLSQLPSCDAHRDLLGVVVDGVRPEILVHGHYHRRWDIRLDRPWGSCRVVGLSEDGSDPLDHMLLLDCDGGTWEVSELTTIESQ